MSGPELTVGAGVIAELVRLAAFEVPGVARVGHGGPAWRALARRPAPSRVRVRDDRVLVRLRIVARPGQALGPLDGAGPRGRRRDGRAPARSRPRGGDRHRRWRRRLTASARPTDGTSAGARRGLRGRLRAAHRERHPRAPPGRGRARRDAAELARELVAAVVAHRDDDRRRDRPRRTAIPGHRAGPDGPRAAPIGHR